jgi:chaperonin GroES
MAKEEFGFTPLTERVVIRPAKTADKVGGIYLPEEAKKKLTRGVVVAVAFDCKTGLKVGDDVYYGQYAGSDMKVGTEDVVILKEEDVLGIFKK